VGPQIIATKRMSTIAHKSICGYRGVSEIFRDVIPNGLTGKANSTTSKSEVQRAKENVVDPIIIIA